MTTGLISDIISSSDTNTLVKFIATFDRYMVKLRPVDVFHWATVLFGKTLDMIDPEAGTKPDKVLLYAAYHGRERKERKKIRYWPEQIIINQRTDLKLI